MTFAWPWCFLFLPLPWLLRRWLGPAASGLALRVPSLPAGNGDPAAPGLSPAAWLALAAWLFLVAAAARPQMPAEGTLPPGKGRSLMLAVDISASMAGADLVRGGQGISRLQAARSLAGAILDRHRGDRVGLLVFGQQAYLHTPLTFDLEAVRNALGTVETGMAGRETALGDVLALGAKYLQNLPANERVLVVLTDGANTAGTLTPARGAWLARRAGVRIHAIGMGAAVGEMDEEALGDMARQTGGSFIQATDGQGLAAFLETLAAGEGGAPAPRPPARELYPWPLGLALVLVLSGLGRRRA